MTLTTDEGRARLKGALDEQAAGLHALNEALRQREEARVALQQSQQQAVLDDLRRRAEVRHVQNTTGPIDTDIEEYVATVNANPYDDQWRSSVDPPQERER